MNLPFKSCGILAALLSGWAISPAAAQNNFHAPADLVLTFQNPGGTTGADQTLTIALANVSTFFRDAAPNSFSLVNSANLTNLGSTLVTTFGTTWYDQPTLWMGAVGFRGTSTTSEQLLDGDPHQTLYFTKVRGASAPTVVAESGSGITAGMGQVKGTIEQFGSSAIFVRPTSSSFIDENNPFTAPGVQNAAYEFIADGVQDRFGAGLFGTVGPAGNVELALDLFRVQTRNNVPGQYGFGQPVNVGQLLGTITINQSGQVGFVAIPEPSTGALLAFAATALIARRRRRAVH